MKKVLNILTALTLTTTPTITSMACGTNTIIITPNQWENLDYEKIKNIEQNLKTKTAGQDYAIQKLKNRLDIIYTGFSSKEKPKANLFFAGPSGVGKSFLVQLFHDSLFDKSQNNLITFDMSEYKGFNSQEHFINQLSQYQSQLKHSNILLFDEIEKADSQIWDNFLQILDKGIITTNTGQTISFANSFIIFTSNVGATNIPYNDKKTEKEIRDLFIEEVKNYFTETLKRPELLGRLGISNIVPFNYISDKNIQTQFITKNLQKIISATKTKYDQILEFKETQMPNIINKIISTLNINLGLRGINDSVEQNVIMPLSQFIIDCNHKFTKQLKIVGKIDQNEIKYSLQPIT